MHSVQQEPGGGEFELRSIDRLLVFFKSAGKVMICVSLVTTAWFWSSCGGWRSCGGRTSGGLGAIIGSDGSNLQKLYLRLFKHLSDQSITGNLQTLLRLFKQHQTNLLTSTWHLKPPAFFFLFERNWNFKVRALLEAGRVSPNPAAKLPKILELSLTT